MEQPQTSTPDVIKYRWDAYKATGKWYAGQEIDLPIEYQTASTAVIRQYVRTHQQQLNPSSFDDFHHVLRETDAQAADPAYTGFVHRLLLTEGL